METEYHSSSYQVEELKANETKLLRQLAELEQQKQELNDLRMKDLDMQLTLQDRYDQVVTGDTFYYKPLSKAKGFFNQKNQRKNVFLGLSCL